MASPSTVRAFDDAICSITCNNPVWVRAMKGSYDHYCPKACNYDARREYNKLKRQNPAMPELSEELEKYFNDSAKTVCHQVCNNPNNANAMCTKICGGIPADIDTGLNTSVHVPPRLQLNSMSPFQSASAFSTYPTETALYGGRRSPMIVQAPYPYMGPAPLPSRYGGYGGYGNHGGRGGRGRSRHRSRRQRQHSRSPGGYTRSSSSYGRV